MIWMFPTPSNNSCDIVPDSSVMSSIANEPTPSASRLP